MVRTIRSPESCTSDTETHYSVCEAFWKNTLTLGLDRDSALIAELYDERNPAVKRLISSLIKTAKRKGVKVGICGQGPSDFPNFAAFLVDEGIDSISVTPDSVLKTIQTQAAHRPVSELVEL